MIKYNHGNNKRTIRKNREISPPSAWECKHDEYTDDQRHTVCHGKRLQMESTAENLRKLAYCVCANEQME